MTACDNSKHFTTLYVLQILNFSLLLLCILFIGYKNNGYDVIATHLPIRTTDYETIKASTLDYDNLKILCQAKEDASRLKRHVTRSEADGPAAGKGYNEIQFEGYSIDHPFVIPSSINQNNWSNFVNACYSLKNFCASPAASKSYDENLEEFKGKVTTINEPPNILNPQNTVQDQAAEDIGSGGTNDVATVIPMSLNLNQYFTDVKQGRSFETVVPLPTKSKFRKRKRCYIDKIGIPLEIGHRKVFYGTWMRDARPKRDSDADKRWVMEHFSGIMLHEYANVGELSQQPDASPAKTYQLPYMYDGTSHAMYNGALYYHRAGLPNIVRYELETNKTRELAINGASFTGSSYLYADNPENYFDLEVDENGIWLIYKYRNVEHLSIARLHPKTLQTLRVWNLTQLNARTVGNAWITCGVLYAIRSSRQQNTSLFVAYDLFRKKYAGVDIPWINPYGNANMVSYNPIDRKIYTYDNGHLMTIPLLLTFDTDRYSIS